MTQVSLEEWLFAFSKLYYCDKKVFEKFITDYYDSVDKRRTFTEVMIENDMGPK